VSLIVAALSVLREHRQPMTLREIEIRIRQEGLVRPVGRTPDRTLSARLYEYWHSHPAGNLVRHAEPGPTRAKRGSVYWIWRDTQADDREGSS
jgi:HB1, ASXL, restriction endonuclease HTH domain